jgi:DNA excision repair protein ERCC-3
MSDLLNPLIVQSDYSVLLEVASPKADDARIALSRFAELEKSPEHIHTYRITPLSLWNAASAGLTPTDVANTLTTFAKYDVPPSILVDTQDQMSRYGRLEIHGTSTALRLTTTQPTVLLEVSADKHVNALLGERLDDHTYAVPSGNRGLLKQALIRLGWPASDEAGYQDGESLDFEMTAQLRTYQNDAVAAWWADGSASGGNGVLVLPCGAGKTVIGLAASARAGCHTLVIATNLLAARQWASELRDKSDIDPELIGEYSGERKDIRPFTVATYQVLTWRDPKASESSDIDVQYPHLNVFRQRQWGTIIYDEVHLLPAPVFRATAEIQAVRRLGLTATLVREDGKEPDVFSLIGPKRFDAPWRELESQGWIAPAICTEVRTDLPEPLRIPYATAPARDRYRISATSDAKLDVLDTLVTRHHKDRVLVIGQYLDQLKAIAERLQAPLVTGQTSERVREQRFAAFRTGEIPLLVVSKVANFSIDLPDANVAIQLSGTFGSRQEEAQRLGRILRPKADGRQAHFYSIVTRETDDQKYATNRQRFLTEQGYSYLIVDAASLRSDDASHVRA